MEKPNVKKRGRKPKGGKIIEQNNPVDSDAFDAELIKQNVILHLKCFKRDVEDVVSVETVEPYCSEISYETVAPQPATAELTIQQKIKNLSTALRTNDVNKKSNCFWCTCSYESPTVHIPKNKINGQYQVYGSFCCPQCAAAFLFAETSVDTTVKFERYHLLNFMYRSSCNYSKNILPAPSPFYMLDKFYGNLTIDEYRTLVQTEQHMLVLDKPICVVFPELVQGNRNLVEKTGETYKLCRKKTVVESNI